MIYDLQTATQKKSVTNADKAKHIDHVCYLLGEAEMKYQSEVLWAEKFFKDARNSMINHGIAIDELSSETQNLYHTLSREVPLAVARYFWGEAQKTESCIAALSECLDKLAEANEDDNFALLGGSEQEFNSLLFKGYKYYAMFRMGRAIEAYDNAQWSEFIQWSEAAVKYKDLANQTMRKNNSFETVTMEMLGVDTQELQSKQSNAAGEIVRARLAFLHENPLPAQKVDDVLVRLNTLLHRYGQSFHALGITLNDITSLRMSARWNDWNNAMRHDKKDAANDITAEMHKISTGQDMLFLMSDKKTFFTAPEFTSEFSQETENTNDNNVVFLSQFAGKSR